MKSLGKWMTPRGKVVFVSYPKSGRTWLRAMLGNYLSLAYEGVTPSAFVDVRALVDKHRLPKVVFTHDGASMKAGLPHARLGEGHRDFSKCKVVFVGRDIRDTLVSAYFQATKRIQVFDGDIGEFVRSEQYGAEKILGFYRLWHEAQREPKDFLYTSYEAMHENAESVLADLLDFMGLEVVPELVHQAVEQCRFDNMKKLEKQGTASSSALLPGDRDDQQSYKVRQGKVGSYVEHLAPEDLNYIEVCAERAGIDPCDPWRLREGRGQVVAR